MRLFQDAAGTIPAYEAGQPIGKVVRAAGTMDVAQVIALSRPTLARWPKGGRRNLLVASEDFNSATWQKTVRGTATAPVVTPNYTTAPDGTNTASLIQMRLNGATDESWSWLYQNLSVPLSVYRMFSVFIKAATEVDIGKEIRLTGVNAVQVVLTGEWQRVSVGGVQGFAQTLSFGIRLRGIEWTSDSVDVLVWGAQVEAGPVSPYQRVTTAFDVTEAGVPDVWHLFNDGGDSLLAPLPNGAHEVATVNHLGKVTYTPVTGDGTGKNILLGERVADIFTRTGTLSDAERLLLEEYWQQRYGAGYLVPPGMVPGARRMRQDGERATPSTLPGQPVGLVVVSSEAEFLGPELNPDRSFDKPSDWVLENATEVSGSTLKFIGHTAIANPRIPISVASGDELKISFEVKAISAGTVRVLAYSASNVALTAHATAVGVYEFYVPVTGGGTAYPGYLVVQGSAGTIAEVDNVSVQKVISPVARQLTALSRPTLARWPKGGQRRNLANNSIDIATAWTIFAEGTGSAAVRQAGVAAPDGSLTATRIQFNRGAGTAAIDLSRVGIGTSKATESGVPYTLSMWIKSNTAESYMLNFQQGGIAPWQATVTPVWTRIALTGVASAAGGSMFFGLRGGQNPVNSITADVSVFGVQFEEGSVASAYQHIVSANDISEAGVPDVWHLWNDGGDSLPAVLPAGSYEIAWVNHLGAISYASVTSDGTDGIDLLRAERMADVALKRGRFTSYEKAQLQTQWEKYKP